MSVDDISHFGRSVLDELVPSRYAQQVGDIEVLVISDGSLPITAPTLATNADPADLAGWLEGMFLPPDVLDWPLNVVVVRSADRTILVDAGLGVEFPDFPRAGQTVHRLMAASIDPADVTDVVLTHLHMDHVGGLLSDGLKAQFDPEMRIHVSTREAEFWEAPDFSRTAMPAPVPEVLRRVASQFLDEYRGRLRPFETEYEVAPGVLISRTGGHTPGHSIVRVESRGDRLTFAGDAVFAPGFDNPEWHNGFEHDPDEAARVRVRCCVNWPRPGRRWWPPICPSPQYAESGWPATLSDAYPRYGPTESRLDRHGRRGRDERTPPSQSTKCTDPLDLSRPNVGLGEKGGGSVKPLEPQAVGHHQHRRERHRRAGDHRVQQT